MKDLKITAEVVNLKMRILRGSVVILIFGFWATKSYSYNDALAPELVLTRSEARTWQEKHDELEKLRVWVDVIYRIPLIDIETPYDAKIIFDMTQFAVMEVERLRKLNLEIEQEKELGRLSIKITSRREMIGARYGDLLSHHRSEVRTKQSA